MSGNHTDRETRIRDYLDGRLSGDELEAFELALFRDSALLDDVEATRVLQRGLRELATQPVVGQVGPKPAPAQTTWRALPMAVSLTAVLGATLTAGYWFGQQSRRGGEDRLQHVLIETLRSNPSTPAPVYAIKNDATLVVLQFPIVDTPDAADYSIELRRGATTLKRESALTLDSDEIVRIDLPANRLGAGDYSATIVKRLKQGGEREYGTVNFSLAQ